MNVFRMINEWKQGCSNSKRGTPEQCLSCTAALIHAIENKLRNDESERQKEINERKTMITTSSESSLSEVVNKINEEL